MSTPTPTQLKACAAELHRLATIQRNHATAAESLLQGVSSLADSGTWSGTYAATNNATFASWVHALQASADAMRSAAKSWDTAADGYDAQAAKTPAAAATH